jgi:hypothetical protein
MSRKLTLSDGADQGVAGGRARMRRTIYTALGTILVVGTAAVLLSRRPAEFANSGKPERAPIEAIKMPLVKPSSEPEWSASSSAPIAVAAPSIPRAAGRPLDAKPGEELISESKRRGFDNGANPEESAGASAETNAGAKISAPPPNLQLYGTLIEESGRRFAFIHDGNRRNRIRKVREGQTIAGALVKTILADQVLIIVSGAEFTLYLRSPKEGVPAPGVSGGGESPDPTSPRPAQLTDSSAPLIQRQWMYPEKAGPEEPSQPLPADQSPETGNE